MPSADEGKFQAASAAFWTGGAFLYVPKNLKVELPIQVVYAIDEPGTAQYAHTLAIVDEHGECYLREYCIAPDFEGQALHAGGFELYCRPGSQVRSGPLPGLGLGRGLRHLHQARGDRPRRALRLGADPPRRAPHEADARHHHRREGLGHAPHGLYFTEGTEHLDLFTTDLHEQGDTTGDTVWKGALTGESRASYEGLIHIVQGAQNTNTYLQTHSMLLSPKAKADSIPSLIVQTDNVSASHGGTVGEVDEEQVFYMMTRGIPRHEAVRILVEGYFEPVIQKLDDRSSRRSSATASPARSRPPRTTVAEYIAQR